MSFHASQFCDDWGTAHPETDAAHRARIDRYIRICQWARARYTVDGRLIIMIGNEPSAYTRITRAAWSRYI